MHKLALGVALAFGVLGAQAAHAQSMSVKSAEVSDGSTIKDEQVANVFGCKGGNISPSLELERRAERRQELRDHSLRSGCADRQRLLALGRVQYFAGNHVDFRRTPAM